MIETDRPHLFSGSAVFVSSDMSRTWRGSSLPSSAWSRLPAYRAHVLAYAADVARHAPKARGVFLGYDFHLGSNAKSIPQLIEINTNAGAAC